MGETVKGATGKTWVRRPAERRTELLDAAERLFVARGVDGVTVADIALEAGVAKGSFYVYFASRDELLGALNARFGEELFGLLDDVLGALVEEGASAMSGSDVAALDSTRIRALLEQSVERMIRTLLNHRGIIEVWSREPRAVGPSAQWLTRFVDRLAPWVSMAGGEGPISCADPTTTALLVVHGIFGAVLQSILLGEDVDLDTLIRSSQDLASRAFGLA